MFRISDYPINSFLEAYKAEMRRAGKEIQTEPYAYNADFVPLNAASSLNQVNATDADASFAIFYTMQSTHNAATGAYIANPQATIRITDDATGRSLEDRPTAINNVFGRGQRPFVWIRPMVIDPKSSWTTTASNLDGAVNFNLRLTYWGVKLYEQPLR